MSITRKNMNALEKTVYIYEDTIEKLESGEMTVNEFQLAFRGYSLSESCRLCTSTMGDSRYQDCTKCVLGPSQRGCLTGSQEASFYALKRAVYNVWDQSPPKVVAILKMRLAAIIKRADENGVEI